MENRKYVVGVDFGSDSVRSIIVDTKNGNVEGSATVEYPRWKDGLYCDKTISQFRQHPQDYLDAFKKCMKIATTEAGKEICNAIVGIGFDTTGSTPCPVNKAGVPLALLPEFKDNPNAMFYLWKDHTAQKEAEKINLVLSDFEGKDYTRFQGIYSSEWYWSKVLHGIHTDEKIREHAYTWIEHADWMPAIMTGKCKPEEMYHNSCSAGHKMLWNSEFGGLPDLNALEKIDPYLKEVGKRFGKAPELSVTAVGKILPVWAEWLGISKNTIVAGSSLDAHAGAVGAGIQKNVLVKVIGTSSVDMLVQDSIHMKGKNLKNICGQAENSILPGYIGIEASQAAFGDIYAWFKNFLVQPLRDFFKESNDAAKVEEDFVKKYQNSLLHQLNEKIKKRKPNENLVILDWFNGRRYPDINENIKGTIYGLTLGTDVYDLYQALVLSTIFGTKKIFDSFINNGLVIDDVIATGGIPHKSEYIMQTMADVLKHKISVVEEKQTCALGAAMYAAVAVGEYDNLQDAQAHMINKKPTVYTPQEKNICLYDKLYSQYLLLGEKTEAYQHLTDK